MQTIGERLEDARKKKGISIREAAEATKIRGDYLQRFESNHFDIGLTEIYTRGFLRNYASFLKLPADRIMNDYATLGRGDVRPRQPSREVYGRMDISVATAGESSDRAAPPDEAPVAEPAPAAAPRAQPRYPRSGGSSLPTGPDPAVVFKYVKIGGIVAAVVIVLLIVKALFSGGSSPANTNRPATSASQSSAATSAPSEQVGALTYKLIATDPVHVRVTTRVAANSTTDAEEIFSGTLMKGESKTIVLSGPQNLYATAGQNLILEWKGRPITLGFTGVGSVPLDIPKTR